MEYMFLIGQRPANAGTRLCVCVCVRERESERERERERDSR
jgi:hypothetical protein